MEKWLKFEFQNLNKNLVKKQILLADLLRMDVPKTVTRDGEKYFFDITSLERFSKAIPAIYQRKLLLPILFYKDLRVKDSCFLSDDIAIKALQKTNDLDPLYQTSENKFWMSRPIAHDIARKYPTLFQFVIY